MDADVLVSALSAASSAHPSLAVEFVKMAAGAVSAALLSNQRLRKEVGQVLGESLENGNESGQMSIQDILGIQVLNFICGFSFSVSIH